MAEMDHRRDISAEASGVVRLALAEMQRRYDAAIADAGKLPPGVVTGIAFSGAVGRDRAWRRLDGIMRQTPTITRERAAVYRLLSPREHPLLNTPRPMRNGIEVQALCIGLSRGTAVVTPAAWSFHVADHALGRLWERARPRVDMTTAIVEAHAALVAAPCDVFNTVVEARDWAIPTPSHAGAFLCSIRIARLTRSGPVDTIAFLTAETWVTTDMLHPEQRAQVAAIQFRTTGPRLGDGLLLPPPLRAVATPVDGIAKLPTGPTLKLNTPKRLREMQAISAE